MYPVYVGVIDMGAEAVKYLRKKGLHAMAAAVAGYGLVDVEWWC